MSWDAVYTIRDAVALLFTASGSTFSTALSAVNSARGTSAPQIANDPRQTSGKAVYTVPSTTYVFPCVEISPPDGLIDEHGSASTTSEVELWVYLSFRGSEVELDSWALSYLTALVRTFLPTALSTASGAKYVWSPVEFSASPVGSTAEGTFVQAVAVRIRATIAESVT